MTCASCPAELAARRWGGVRRYCLDCAAKRVAAKRGKLPDGSIWSLTCVKCDLDFTAPRRGRRPKRCPACATAPRRPKEEERPEREELEAVIHRLRVLVAELREENGRLRRMLPRERADAARFVF